MVDDIRPRADGLRKLCHIGRRVAYPLNGFAALRKHVGVDCDAFRKHREHRTVYFAVLCAGEGRNFDDLRHIGQVFRFEDQSAQNGRFKLGRFRERQTVGAVTGNCIFALFHGLWFLRVC